MLRILTDRGTEYCGRPDAHDYQLYLAINDIYHTKIKARSPQTNGICERFHKTILQEFCQVNFHKRIYSTLEGLQQSLNEGSLRCATTSLSVLELMQEQSAALLARNARKEFPVKGSSFLH